MNNYIKELMEQAKEAVGRVFILADRIAGLCGIVFDNAVNDMQFDPSTLTYVLIDGNGEYRIHMNMDQMAVEVTGRSARSENVVAFCHVGVNGSFKIEYGRGFNSIKDPALKLFDLIEGINLSTLQEEFESTDNSNSQDVEVEVVSDEDDE